MKQQTHAQFLVMFNILLFPLLFLVSHSFLSLSLSLILVGACWFHVLPTPLCYFCTEIRRRLPFRSQSHISVEFFWHRKQKRALQKNSIFQPISFGKLTIQRSIPGRHFYGNCLKWNQHRLKSVILSAQVEQVMIRPWGDTWTSPFLKISKHFKSWCSKSTYKE